MARILYERLDRRTGWFESNTATHFGNGVNQGRHGSHFGNGLIRAMDGLDGQPVWVKYGWNGFSVMTPPQGGLDHWQVTLDEAARWFPLNRAEPPDALIGDLASRRDSTPAPPGNPPASENEPAAHLPSIEHVNELLRTLQRFIAHNRYSAGSTWQQENEVLPLFTGVADALRPIREVMNGIKGWPPRVERGLQFIMEAFDETARTWGWERLADDVAERSAFINERRAWVREHLARPRFEAALSWQAGCRTPICPVEDIADKGREEGFSATMTAEEGQAAFKDADIHWHRTPHLGRCYPTIDDPEERKLSAGWSAVDTALKAVAKNVEAASATGGNLTPDSTEARPETPTIIAGRTGTPSGPMDIGVVIALPEEFGYFHAEIEKDCTPVKDPTTGRYDYVFERAGGLRRPYRCVAAVVGEMGPTKASLLTEGLIARWQPRTLVVIGLAGGIGGDVQLGDVVIGTQVDAYLENSKAIPGNGKQEFTFELAGEVYRPSADLIQAARHFRFANKPLYGHWTADGAADLAGILSNSDRERLSSANLIRKEPAYVEGAVASGPTVASAGSFVRWIKERNRKFLAIEMESAGVLAAIYQRADPARSLVLRAISDFADERKAELDRVQGGGLRRYAMGNACRLLWRLLEAGELPQHESKDL
jgi:nucleoside phosphorylase